MALFLAPIINGQQFDANGAPLNGGTIGVFFTQSSVPSTTYTSQAASTPNSNPIVLNTLGVNAAGDIWVSQGFEYTFVIKDAAGVVLRTIHDVTGINDNTVTADQWVLYQTTPTYVSATSFTVPGDQTQTFTFGTRVKTTNTGGTIYGTVVSSVYSTSTTVTIIPDSGSLDSGLSAVSIGLITAVDASLPGTLTLPPFRNRLINGALRIDQRNAGAAQTITAAAAIAYTADRFYASCTGANVTTQRVAGAGYQYALTITGATSNTQTLFGHRIESFNCRDWANRQVNVQVPISAVGITTVTWNAYVADVADVFSAKTLLATGSLTLSGTVATKYFSFAAGANAARGIAIEFVTGALVAGQSITYQGAFQAEAGQVSSFEAVCLSDELLRCQRYYQLTYVGMQYVATVGAQVYSTNYSFPVLMRNTPTMGLYAGGTGVNATIAVVAPASRGFRIDVTSTAAGACVATDFVYSASIEL